MGYSVLQNSPIFINLLDAANYTGWSVDGVIATHSSCQPGNMNLMGYLIVPCTSYSVTYQVISISGGEVQLTFGGIAGSVVTTPGYVTQTFTSATNSAFIYSNANCQIQLLAVQTNPLPISPAQQNTIAYSDHTGGEEETDKWGSFYTKIPDIGGSLFENTYEFNQGQMYVAQHNSGNRCNFFGTQFPATIVFSTNQQPSISKTFLSVNYQCNELLVTSASGIATSLGQLSELIPTDFLQQEYTDGSQIFSVEGIYKASFMRDMKVDIINGDPLKGNWLTISLTTESPSAVLNLFSTEIAYNHSFANTR